MELRVKMIPTVRKNRTGHDGTLARRLLAGLLASASLFLYGLYEIARARRDR